MYKYEEMESCIVATYPVLSMTTLDNVHASIILSRHKNNMRKQNIIHILFAKDNISEEEKNEADYEILTNTQNSESVCNDDSLCNICRSLLNTFHCVLLSCGHFFHECCYIEHVKSCNTCFDCKKSSHNELYVDGVWNRLVARLSLSERRFIMK